MELCSNVAIVANTRKSDLWLNNAYLGHGVDNLLEPLISPAANRAELLSRAGSLRGEASVRLSTYQSRLLRGAR